MSRDMVDVIDNALADWSISGDAMRWTPEPKPEPTVAFDVQVDIRPFMDAVAEMQRSLAQAFMQAAPALERLVAAFRLLPIPTADDEKRTCIRQQYRRRALARRRR